MGDVPALSIEIMDLDAAMADELEGYLDDEANDGWDGLIVWENV